MRKTFFLLMCLWCATTAYAQYADYGKMSSMIRQLTLQQRGRARHLPARDGGGEVCAFVRVGGEGGEVLRAMGCRPLAQWGDIYIASIPLDRLSALSQERSVSRITVKF